MATNFWFKFNYKDWSNDVKPLSLGARGLLIELIIYMQEHNGEIENNINLISRLSGGLTEQITEHLTEFKNFAILDFTEINGKHFLVSRRIKKKIKQSIVNQSNGSKGGNPRLTDSVNQNSTEGVNQTPNSNSLLLNTNKDLREIFLNDLPNSTDLENICRDVKKEKLEVLNYLPEFMKSKAKPSYSNFNDFSSHFKSCYVLFLKSTTQAQPKRHQPSIINPNK